MQYNISNDTINDYENWYQSQPMWWRWWNSFLWRMGNLRAAFWGMSPGEKLLLRALVAEQEKIESFESSSHELNYEWLRRTTNVPVGTWK